MTSASHEPRINKKALLIAVSDYADPELSALPFCKNDGEAVFQILRKQQYAIPDKWKLIGKIKGDRIERAVGDFFREAAKKEDTLFFYFSGHGVPDSWGDHYMAAHNIDAKNPDKQGFNFLELQHKMTRSAAGKILAVLDCCFSGAAKVGKGKSIDHAALARGSLEKRFELGTGRCLLASSLEAQSSYAMEGEKYSRFTYYLIRGLKGANGESVTAEGYVTPNSLSNYIYDNIPLLNEQKPVTKAEMSGDMIIASYPKLAKLNPISREQTLIGLLNSGKIGKFNEATQDIKLKGDKHYRLILAGQEIRASIAGADLHNVDLSRSLLEQVTFSNSDLRNSNLQGISAGGSRFYDTNLESVNLKSANLRHTIFWNVKLSGASLQDAVLDGAHLDNVDLSNTDLTHAKLLDAIFLNVDFSNADLSNADLSYSIILNSKGFSGANCLNTKFSEAIIDSPEMVNYLKGYLVRNIPVIRSRQGLQKQLERRGYKVSQVYNIIQLSAFATKKQTTP